MRAFSLLVVLALTACQSKAEPVSRDRIEIVDGDTIRISGESWRLMGFDTPETFYAKCTAERERGDAATKRLGGLIAAAKSIEAIPSGRHDRYRRVLGVLIIDGVDVAETMILEGHARPYQGRVRKGWCDGQD